MSENELGALCDEEKMLAYIYEDVDDSDIFATEARNSSTESDHRSEADLSTEPITAQNPDIIKESNSLKETVEKLQKEKEILQLRISELYKTARAELERKDRRLKDLEKEKDNILFRRVNNVRNNPFGVDARLPVMQLVEIDLPDEKSQSYNARYRIPKKQSTTLASNSAVTNKNGTTNEEVPKKASEVRSENKNAPREKDSRVAVQQQGEIGLTNEKIQNCNARYRIPKKPYEVELENKNMQKGHSDRYWSAYPHLNDKPSRYDIKESNGEDDDRNKKSKGQFLADKESRDRHIIDRSRPRSRPRERFDPRKQTNTNSKTIRSPPNEHVSPSSKSFKQQSVQESSKSFSRHRYDPPENNTNRDILSREERKPDLLKDRIHSSPTSKETEQVQLSRERNRSPSNGNNTHSRSKSIGRYKVGSPQHDKRQPRTPSMEREHTELTTESSRSRPKDEYIKMRNKSTDRDIQLEDRIYSSPTSRERERVHLSRGRSRPQFDEKNNQNRSKSAGRYRPRSPKYQVRQPETPPIETEQIEFPKESNRSRSKGRAGSRSPSNENNRQIKKYRSKSAGRFRQSSPEDRIKQPRTPSREGEQEESTEALRRSRSTDQERSREREQKEELLKELSRSRTKHEDIKSTDHRGRSKSKSRGEDVRSIDDAGRSKSRSRCEDVRSADDGRKSKFEASQRGRSKSRSRGDDVRSTDDTGRGENVRSADDGRRSKSEESNKFRLGGSNSTSQEKENIYTDNRKCKEDDFMQRDSQVNRDNFNNRKNEETKILNKADYCDSRHSLWDKGSTARNSNGSDSIGRERDKYRCSRDEQMRFDLREKCLRRPRSVSRDRDYRRHASRRSRSTSKERYLRRPPERGRYRHWRDRSRSNSVERDERDRYRYRADFPGRRGRHWNVFNSRRNRSRPNSRDRPFNLNIRGLENRDRKSRVRDYGRLRERLLRYSIGRERQALKEHLQEDRNLNQNIPRNHDKKKGPLNYETDQSDLDDLKLHLSGESDMESVENFKEHRGVNSEDDHDLKLLLDLGVDPRTVTDEQLERLLEKRRDVYNNVSDPSNVHNKETGKDHDESDQKEQSDAQICKSDGELSYSDEEHNTQQQIPRRNNEFWYPQNEEELDYESSQHEFPKYSAVKEFKHTKSTENTFRKIPESTEIVQQNKEKEVKKTNIEKEIKNERDKVDHNTETRHIQQVSSGINSCEHDQKQFKTMFELRQHQKIMNKQNLKSAESSKIVRSSAQVPESKGVNFSEEKDTTTSVRKKPENETHISEKGKDTILLQNMHKAQKRSEDNRQALITGKETYSHVFKDIDHLKQECKEFSQMCNTTRSEITATLGLSKVTKGIDSGKELETGKSDLEAQEEENDDNTEVKQLTTVEKEVDQVVKKTREKISVNAYMSRRKSTDVRVMIVDLKEPDSGAVTASENNQIETKINEEKISDTSKKQSQKNADLHDSEDSIQKNDKSTDRSNKPNSDSELLARNNEKNSDSVTKEQMIPFINDEQSEINVGTEVEGHEHDNDSYKDRSSFIHDFSLSDDDGDLFEESPVSCKLDPLSEYNKKIFILSNITIQSPSYTPPHPPPQTSENALHEINNDVSESNNMKYRKYLFPNDVQATQDAVANIPVVEETDFPSNRSPSYIQNIVERASQIYENIPQITTDSEKTSPKLPHEECIAEIQEAVNNMIGDSTIHNSASGTSNIITEQLNTEELQKCLEEGINKSKSGSLDYNNPAKEKATSSSVEARIKADKTQIKNTENSGERSDKEDNIKKIDKKQHEQRSEAVPPEEKQNESHAVKMLKLFGPMTPSPCKPVESLKRNVDKDKAKRNIIKDDTANNGNIGVKVSVKINDKINQNTKGITAITRRKTVDVRTIQETQNMSPVIIIGPEDVKKCKPLMKCLEEKRVSLGLSGFCSNPTYIPGNIRDTPKAVFDSPNHYIQRKNEEMMKKVKRNLNEDPSDVKVEEQNFKEKNIEKNEQLMKNEEENMFTENDIEKHNQKPVSQEDLSEDNSKKETSKPKQKEAKKASSVGKQDGKNVPKVRGRPPKKNAKKTNADEESYEEEKDENNVPKVKENLTKRKVKNKIAGEESSEDEKDEEYLPKVKAKRAKKNIKNKNAEEKSNKRKKDENSIPKGRAKQSKINVKKKIAEEESSEEDGDEEYIPKVKAKRPKKNIRNKDAEEESSEEEEDEKSVPIVRPKRPKRNVRSKSTGEDTNEDLTAKQSKKKLTSGDAVEDNKARNPSFKIKINIPTKRQKNISRKFVLDSEDSSDLFEEPCETVNNPKSKKQKIEEKKCAKECTGLENSSLSDARQIPIENPDKKENMPVPEDLKDEKVTKGDNQIKEENRKETEVKEQTRERLKEGQKDQENVELKGNKQNMVNYQELLDKNAAKAATKGTGIEDKSLQNSSNPDTSRESIREQSKTVKRITPKRIDDSSFKKRKEQKELKAKRELFLDNPSLESGDNKRKRSSSFSDDLRTEKYQRVTYTETRRTVEEAVMDNSAQTRIKLQETHLSIAVAPNSSPLSRIEHTYDVLSRSKAVNSGDNAGKSQVIDAQLRPTHETNFAENAQLHAAESTFPEINLDTKDLPMLGPIENNIYLNLSDISMSDKSILLLDNIAVHSERNVKEGEQLSFTNFLNNKDSNTSTPIRGRATSSKGEIHIRDKSQNVGSVVTSSNKPDLLANIASKSSSTNLPNTLTTPCPKPVANTNVSYDKESSGMTTGSVSGGNSVSKTHVKFSRTLKRDRRRPISMMVVD